MWNLKIQSCFPFVLPCLPRCFRGSIEVATSAHLIFWCTIFCIICSRRRLHVCVCLSMYVGVIAWVRGRDMSMRLQFFCIIYSILFIPYCFFCIVYSMFFFLFGNFCWSVRVGAVAVGGCFVGFRRGDLLIVIACRLFIPYNLFHILHLYIYKFTNAFAVFLCSLFTKTSI